MIRREDLVAAAALGLLQYRQIDPLLVFLLQRDVIAKRRELMAGATARQVGGASLVRSYLFTLLLVLAAMLVAVLFTSRAVQTNGIGALFFMTLMYGLGAILLTGWFKRQGYCGRIRAAIAVSMAAAPLAVFAVQQIAH